MLINRVVQNEYERNQRMIAQYEALMSDLPKGSLICRKNGYYYLKYRENGKLHDDYIGKDNSVISEIREKLLLRKHYTEMLSALKKEQKLINKLLEDIA